jgi:tRNA-uridine 2-sulfurtransferase
MDINSLLNITEETISQNSHKMVVVGMSGGVDSSVTALIAKAMGYKTIGVFMKNWEEAGECTAEDDWRDAKKVAGQIDIPIYSVNFSEQYKNLVFSTFLKEYNEGHTPNPDILCNKEIKFKVFTDYAKSLGADYLATGHYCQTDGVNLLKGADPSKDQSYFLYAMNGEELKNVLFPIGSLLKSQVREIAHHYNLATKAKKDSTGVCFIGERDFKEFLSNYIETQKGEFQDLNGKVLGPHDGVCFYTLGQRKGLGIGGAGEAWFVVKKNLATNVVILAQGEDHPALFSDGLTAGDETWIATRPEFPLRCKAKVRYRQVEEDCTVYDENGILKVLFDRPQRAITSRQSVVFYQDSVCLGGAMIIEASPSYYDLGLSLPV